MRIKLKKQYECSGSVCFQDSSLAAQLAAAHEDDMLDLPFELAPDQEDFASWQPSALAIGRSGTGKTTALEKKL